MEGEIGVFSPAVARQIYDFVSGRGQANVGAVGGHNDGRVGLRFAWCIVEPVIDDDGVLTAGTKLKRADCPNTLNNIDTLEGNYSAANGGEVNIYNFPVFLNASGSTSSRNPILGFGWVPPGFWFPAIDIFYTDSATAIAWNEETYRPWPQGIHRIGPGMAMVRGEMNAHGLEIASGVVISATEFETPGWGTVGTTVGTPTVALWCDFRGKWTVIAQPCPTDGYT